ncbi:MAG: hypothetical protein AB1489_38215 [Acidobacteriota bacterium]
MNTFAQVAVKSLNKSESLRKYEFLCFSVLAFLAKSMLLVRLPYRSASINALYTTLLLLLFYCYFRFRQKLILPPIMVCFLAVAVAVDVIGNFFGLYGLEFGPLQYDEFSHCLGAGLSLPPTLWLLRATTRRLGYKLPLDLLCFLSVSITFSFCAYYEILELWDEQYFNGKRLWTPQDSANDLQWDLTGIIVAVLISALVFKLSEREERTATSAALI